MPIDRELPEADERYECATNAGDLSVTPTELQAGALDAVLAGAWGGGKMGTALLRLAAQWAAEKPKPPAEAPSVGRLMAEGMTREEAQAEHDAQAAARARTYERQLSWLVGRLHELPKVRDQLTDVAVQWGMGEPDPEVRRALQARRQADAERLRTLLLEADAAGHAVAALDRLGDALATVRARRAAEEKAQRTRAAPLAAAVVRFWLDQACRTCQGRMYRLISGTPVLSSRLCPQPPAGCGGTGKAQVPGGEAGRRLASHLDQCQYRAKQGIRNKLRGRRRRVAPQQGRS